MHLLVIAVQHLTDQPVSQQLVIQSEQNVIPSGYINSTSFGHKHSKLVFQEVMSSGSFSDCNQKHLLIKKAYLMQRNYTLDIHNVTSEVNISN